VDDYINVLENIDAMIYERGFKKLLFYHRVGLNNIQIFTRQHSKDKGYYSWQIEKIRKLEENLWVFATFFCLQIQEKLYRNICKLFANNFWRH
jgi:hypothetical protein